MQLLHEALSRSSQAPHAPAVVYGDVVLSWAEFIDTAGRLATLFESRNIKTGQIVALTGFSAIMQTVLVAATWFRAGVSAILPGGFLDSPSFEPDWVLTPELIPSIPVSKQILVDDVALQTLGSFTPQQIPLDYPHESSVCHLLFSSGTTGQMKAIPYTIDRVVNRARATSLNWRTHRPFMTSLGFRSASGFNTFAENLLSGTPYLIAEDIDSLISTIKDFNVQTLLASPHDAAILARRLEEEQPGFVPLTVIQTTGSLISNRLRDRLSTLTGAALHNMYGSSEVGFVAIGRPGDSETGYVGEILEDIHVEVVHQNGSLVKAGDVGELRMRRSGQPNELFGNINSSSLVFREGWYYPGDVGYIKGTQLFVVGRTTELLNSGGIKIFAPELEAALTNLPGISDVACCVVTSSDDIPKIVALVVPETHFDVNPVRSRLTQSFGERAPSVYYIVDKIPRNANGKILRQNLISLVPTE